MAVLTGIKDWVASLPREQVDQEKALKWVSALNRKSQLWLLANKEKIKLNKLRRYYSAVDNNDSSAEDNKNTFFEKSNESKTSEKVPDKTAQDEVQPVYQLNDYAKELFKQLNETK
jgi:hypothetical protein